MKLRYYVVEGGEGLCVEVREEFEKVGEVGDGDGMRL